MNISAQYVCDVYRDLQRASDPWKLELRVVVSHHVGAGN